MSQSRWRDLLKAGFNVIEAWQRETEKNKRQNKFQNANKNLPRAILYDFESFMDSRQQKKPTAMLALENEHVQGLWSGSRASYSRIHQVERGLCAGRLVQRIKGGSWFGFAEVDKEIARDLWPKLDEMGP